MRLSVFLEVEIVAGEIARDATLAVADGGHPGHNVHVGGKSGLLRRHGEGAAEQEGAA